MIVDMHEYKFRNSLLGLELFTPSRSIDSDVLYIDFPAWRAIFSSLLLYGHSTGYRIPSFIDFSAYCERVYTHSSHMGRFDKWFTAGERKRVAERFKLWYESGIRETYLYVCLVETFEDVLRDGVVMYDPRVDWKHKWDSALIRNGIVFSMNTFWGDISSRTETEKKRDATELHRKSNTIASSHWGNKTRETGIEIKIPVSDGNCQIVNGMRLMSIDSFNNALRSIYDSSGIGNGGIWMMPESDTGRKDLYYSLIGKKKNQERLININESSLTIHQE